MPEGYKILSVGNPREWESPTHGGRFKAYPLTLEGEGEEVEWSRKAASDPPRVGDTLYGAIAGGAHGKKIKVDWDAMQENRGSSPPRSGRPPNGGGRTYKPEHEFDPAKTARITRSHSQKVAVDLVTSMPGFGQSPDVRKREVLTQWTDFFEADVEEAALQKTAQDEAGAAGARPSAPPPTQTPDTEDDSVPF